jgi:hypothetical protein
MNVPRQRHAILDIDGRSHAILRARLLGIHFRGASGGASPR